MVIENIVWILPRPKPDHYRGGFPLWFEEKLLKLFNYDYKNEDLKNKVVHLFAGMTKFGYRIDINPEVNPDLVADCHKLPDELANKFELTICDPPYNENYSDKLYGTKKPVYSKYISEAVRITKPGGYICSYHYMITPRPNGTHFYKRIFIGTRVWHRPRVCCIFQKEED